MQSLPTAGGMECGGGKVSRLDYVTTLNAGAQTLVAVPLSVLCFALVLAVIGAASQLRCEAGREALDAARAARRGIYAQSAVGMLLAPLLVPPTLWEYGLRIAAWMAALTFLDYVFGPSAARVAAACSVQPLYARCDRV